MMSPRDRPPLVLIAGPTASGKSALALAFAEAHHGTVINADSAQVYRDLRVLSARPSPEEERLVPHRLFGHVDGADAYSAARWADEAKAAIGEAHGQGRIPVLVGGTGMYLRTLLDGIAPMPAIDPAIRSEVRALPVVDAHAALAQEDPDAARRLNPADTTRVARALEVVRATGRPMSAWQRTRVGGIAEHVRLTPLVLLPSREWLVARCDARLDAMVAAGAVEEARALAARGLPDTLPVCRAIGVREFAALASGSRPLEDALARAKLATRQYAKRQYTWFRNQSPPQWPRTEAESLSTRMDHLESYYNIGG